ncbi:MAG: hypothetical protein HWN65_00680 [Candidatus Helarchaeota archaeon]|nr:hypothetical protein [Candidatus Helarchaeota archaeon]
MKIVDEEKYQKNAEILITQWIKEFEATLREIKKLIREDFYSGVWGLLFNRIIVLIYKLFFSSEIRKKVLSQFELILEVGKEYDENPEEILDKYFDEYLKNDPAYARIEKNHPKTPEIVERIKHQFLLLVKRANNLLNSEGETYYDLIFDAYKTKDAAEKAYTELMRNTEDHVEFAIKNKLLKISSLVRKPIIKIVRKELEIGKKYAKNKLNDVFSPTDSEG